ncbi:MAG: hypothetical protein LKJ86_00880 [Oscillibacter sp.]|jgi:glycosyl-4,4'-diaponeurosporenoate acyltransferase|nr:hypothetical protein [Oscillibacter sp.]
MKFALMMTVVNSAFWFFLHFGLAGLVTALPQDVKARLFDPARPCFQVSDGEMRFYRKIHLPRWKDSLPQFNPEFDKRHLRVQLTEGYLNEFLLITCKAEFIHVAIAVLGFLSLLFSLACDDPAWNLLHIFLPIAVVLALCNLPFAMIQRYNRYRLVRLKGQFARRTSAGLSERSVL